MPLPVVCIHTWAVCASTHEFAAFPFTSVDWCKHLYYYRPSRSYLQVDLFLLQVGVLGCIRFLGPQMLLVLSPGPLELATWLRAPEQQQRQRQQQKEVHCIGQVI
jgi:hypothetical protein